VVSLIAFVEKEQRKRRKEEAYEGDKEQKQENGPGSRHHHRFWINCRFFCAGNHSLVNFVFFRDLIG